MERLDRKAPTLYVTGHDSFNFGEWLDLVKSSVWIDPHSGNETRFDGVELNVPPNITPDNFRGYCQYVAHEAGSRGLVIGAIHPCLSRGSALSNAEQQAQFLDAARTGVLIGRLLSEWGLRMTKVIRLDSAASTADWVSDNMTDGSFRVKYCLREVVEFAANQNQICALEMQCDRACMCSPDSILRLLSAIYRPGVGILADMAELAYCIFDSNFPNSPVVARDGSGGRAEFDSAFRRMCASIGQDVCAVHISQTIREAITKHTPGAPRDHTAADHPAGIFDLPHHAQILLSHVPGGIETLQSLSWDATPFIPTELPTRAMLAGALQALDGIVQVCGRAPQRA